MLNTNVSKLHASYNILCESKKTAQFYFFNNFVKQSSFDNFWHMNSEINFLSIIFYIF